MRCWEHAPKRDTYRLEGGHTHHTLLACANRARDAPPANSARLEFPCQPSLSPLPPPPPSTTHPVSCGFASPDPVSTFRLPPPSLALTEFQCEKAFLSRKIEGKKKERKVYRIRSRLSPLFEANKGHPASVFHRHRVNIYEWILTSVPRSISVEAILFPPTKRSEVFRVSLSQLSDSKDLAC